MKDMDNNNGKKNRQLSFNSAIEQRLMELWHNMKMSMQGEMMMDSGKFKVINEKLSLFLCCEWMTTNQVQNKIDALPKKKKKTMGLMLL